MPHRRLLVSALLASLGGSAPALADDRACELAPALATLGRLAAAGTPATAASLRLEAGPTAVRIVTADAAAAPLLTVTCDGATVPTPSARHQRGASWTIARGRHAVSLDLAPGALLREGVHVLVLDDGGLSVSLGDAAATPDRPRPSTLMYSRELRPTGELVEREGPRVGCGCERVTGADGRRVERPLPSIAPR